MLAQVGKEQQKSTHVTDEGDSLIKHLSELKVSYCNSSFIEKGGTDHLDIARSDITVSSLNVVRDPLDEVGRVLLLNRHHAVLNFPHGNFTTEESGNGEVLHDDGG